MGVDIHGVPIHTGSYSWRTWWGRTRLRRGSGAWLALSRSPTIILHVTPKTAALVGESPAEWQLLEKQVRSGRWTTGSRADEARLLALAMELKVPLWEEGASCDGSRSANLKHRKTDNCLTILAERNDSSMVLLLAPPIQGRCSCDRRRILKDRYGWSLDSRQI
jgi:hypothetical protein